MEGVGQCQGGEGLGGSEGIVVGQMLPSNENAFAGGEVGEGGREGISNGHTTSGTTD